MKTELQQKLAELKQGEHVCLIYESKAEQWAAVAAFLAAGLRRGERCVYIADGPNFERIVQSFEPGGVDTARERERGALRLLTNQETYLRAAEFVNQAMIDFVRHAETEALADGFSGLRLTGEPPWPFGPEPGFQRLVEYEALLDHLATYSKSVILCQYHLSRFEVPCIHDLLRTHPVVILGDRVCPNPYYELPETALRTDQPDTAHDFQAKRVDWWVAQLERASMAEQERERALEKLRKSERRLAEAQRVAHVGSWERDLRTNEVTWSDELYRLFGLPIDNGEISYQQFLSLVSPQDVERIRAVADAAIRERRPFNCDYRITLSDGSVRELNDRGSVILSDEGLPIRLVGTAQDVTERKRAEKELREHSENVQALTRRLLEVQEEEHRHLARELHDDFGQVLAAITLRLHAARCLAGDAARAQLDECAALLQQAGEQIRNLSLELRPAMLDTLGLEATLRWLGEQHQQRTGCEVRVVCHLSGPPTSPEIAISCYRVAQEALTNVVRHAAAPHVWLELSQNEDLLELAIRDDRAGFDAATAREHAAKRGRLGLLGMAERVHLLGGSLQVESEPGRGARIRASFPLREAPSDPSEQEE